MAEPSFINLLGILARLTGNPRNPAMGGEFMDERIQTHNPWVPGIDNPAAEPYQDRVKRYLDRSADIEKRPWTRIRSFTKKPGINYGPTISKDDLMRSQLLPPDPDEKTRL